MENDTTQPVTDPASPELPPELTAEVQGFLAQLQVFIEGLLRPYQLWQVAITVAVFIVAWGLQAWIAPRIHDWMRGLEGRPKWQLRWLLILHRRTTLILFVILQWSVILYMREVLNTFPSRTYLLALIGTVSFAWVAITLATIVIKSEFLRRLVRGGGWAWVTLYYLGLLDTTSNILDSAAVDFGDFHLSILVVFKAVAVTGLLIFGAKLVSTATATKVRSNEEISPSMQVLVVKFAQMVLYGSAFFIGLKAVGFDLTGLAVLSGAIGVGLGFGLQKVVSNLVSGIIILLDKSIKPGDVISLGDTFGWIDSLGARYVSVVTRDGREYLIPNEDLITGQVVNWSHSNDLVRLDIYFGTAYGCDPHAVRKIAIDAAKSVGRVLTAKAPVCHIVGFGDSSVDYILRFWITDPTGGLTNIRGNVYLALWDAFKEHGIDLPFPQREVRILNESNNDTPQIID
ncbi:mechanosensitive ion channel family protein [Halocynthiibacter namhaensis]|uniref:mechanosensitive ion channel family protein n=1 Tax=Halocynthiibacter namhaensis TaxID=1290553 RepID=UPI0009DF946E|nr:mechanosensitive ion channel domain-containing protein [Halocynthiibacter namhaensis]